MSIHNRDKEIIDLNIKAGIAFTLVSIAILLAIFLLFK